MSTTRAQFRTSVRVEADQDNSTFPTDTAVNEFIDRAARTVWRRMIAVGWKPDRTTVSITANGAVSYTVGSDVSTVNSVMYLGSPSSSAYRVPLRRAKAEDLPDLLAQPAGSPATNYDLIGGATTALSIELYPTPSSGSYEVRYTKRFPGFASDADTWIGPDGSDELIILTAAIESAMKEEDPGALVNGEMGLAARLAMRWSDVIEAAGWMDTQGQQTVRDVNRSIRRAPFDFVGREAWDE